MEYNEAKQALESEVNLLRALLQVSIEAEAESKAEALKRSATCNNLRKRLLEASLALDDLKYNPLA